MKKQGLTWFFGAYLLLLSWGILFKFQTHLYFFVNYRSINWIPFASPMVLNGHIVWEEMAFNVLVFIPVGLGLAHQKPKWSLFRQLLFGGLLSLSYEVCQYLLAIGMADITDFLLNSTGTLIGLMLYRQYHKNS